MSTLNDCLSTTAATGDLRRTNSLGCVARTGSGPPSTNCASVDSKAVPGTDGEVNVTGEKSVSRQSLAGSLLFSALPDPLLIIDAQRCIVNVNPAAAKFFLLDPRVIATRRLSLDDLLPGFGHLTDRAEAALAVSAGWHGKLTANNQYGDARQLDVSFWRQSTAITANASLIIVMCRDSTAQCQRRQAEQRRVQRSLRDSELRFWRVADAAPVMIWQTDRDGKYNYLNRRLLEFTGRVAGREFNADWRVDMHPADRERCDEAMQRAVGVRESFEIDYRLRQRDGTYRWLIDNGMPRYGATGVFEGYVGSCIDISAFKKLEQSLQRKTSELVDAAARKDTFLAMLSHELRNPLAPITNSLAVMRNADFTDTVTANSFAIIERQFKHLRQLVNDLLDIERITGGNISMRRTPVSAQHIVDRALEISMPAMRAAHHQLTVQVMQSEVMVSADPMRIAQALSNLLDNAAKFTGEGGIISLDVDVDDADVCFAVRDNGIGFDKGFQKQLFTPFVQADQSLARTRSGLGIGLAMAHQIVQHHDGTITANSDGAGHGSRFVLTLPVLAETADLSPFALTATIECPSNRLSEEPTVPTQTDKAAEFRILLVDDNEDANDSMAALLELLDYDVRTATDGATALKITAEFEPQLILSDIGLPGMDGYQLAPALRKVAGSRKLVIAAATGYGHASDRARSLAAGFDHHLVKPLDADALLDFVAQQAANY